MNLQTINTPPSLSDIELEIIRMSEMLRQGWFAVGTKLLLVEKHELYKQGKKKSFTSWLNALSKTLDLKPSTLWKYLKIVRMIDDINLPTDNVNLKNVTGLEQIARIYDVNQDANEAIALTKLLEEKVINVALITKLAKVTSTTPILEEHPEKDISEPLDHKKGFWTNSSKSFLAVVTPKTTISLSFILLIVFYIKDMY
jgi:hypothetical protein